MVSCLLDEIRLCDLSHTLRKVIWLVNNDLSAKDANFVVSLLTIVELRLWEFLLTC